MYELLLRSAQLSTFLTHCYTRGSIVDTGELCGHSFSLFINIKAQPPSLTFTAEGSAGRRNNSQWNEEDGIDSLQISQSLWSTITFTLLIYLKPKDKLQAAGSIASADPSRVISNALFSLDRIVYRAFMVDWFYFCHFDVQKKAFLQEQAICPQTLICLVLKEK